MTATGTTQTAFLLANGNVAVVSVPQQTAILGAQTLPDPNPNPSFSGPGAPYNPNAQVMNPLFNSGSFDFARPFRIRAVGSFTSGNAANTLQMTLALGTSATFGSDTSFYAPSASTAIGSGAVGQYQMEVNCFWDSTTGKLGGIGEFWTAVGTGNLQARAAITPITVAAYTSLSFVLFYTWGVGASANTIKLSELAIERV